MTDSEQEASPSSESIMADLWSAPDGTQEALLDSLNELFEHLRRCPGFIEGQTLRGVNPTKILAYARFDSAAAQQQAQDSPGVDALVRGLREIAHQNLGRYTVAETFLPPD
jgi:heme-degrading monooxygenase HmoA